MKVTLMPGIETISGTLKSKRNQGVRVIFARRKNDQPGQGRMYFRYREDYQRSTPVTPQELLRRQLFGEAARETRQKIAAGDKRPRKIIFREIYDKLVYREQTLGNL